MTTNPYCSLRERWHISQSPWKVMAQGPVVHGALRVIPGALLLSAAWVLCVPPSRALVTATTAGKALNHGTDDHRPIFALFASADIPKPTSRHPKCWCCLFCLQIFNNTVDDVAVILTRVSQTLITVNCLLMTPKFIIDHCSLE